MARVMEHHCVGRVAQKRGSACHRVENATLSFDSQVCVNSREVRHESRTSDSD